MKIVVMATKAILLSDGVARDSGGESGRRARAGRHFVSVSLLAQAPCPDSPPLFQSTPSDGSDV